MKIIPTSIILCILWSNCIWACDEKVVNRSKFIVGVSIEKSDSNQSCRRLSVLTQDRPGEGQLASIYFHLLEKNKKAIAFFSPFLEDHGGGYNLFRVCLAPEYIESSVIVVNSKPASPVVLKEDGSVTLSSSLCLNTEYVSVGGALKVYSSAKK